MRELDERDPLRRLFTDLEMPLVPVLVAMEMHGMVVDAAYLAQMSTRDDATVWTT